MGNEKTSYHHGDLRAALLTSAVGILNEEGIEQLTMRSLSQRAGVSRSAPYRHFESKAALLAAVAEEGFRSLTACLRTAEGNGPGDELLQFREMGVAYVRFATDHPGHYRLMFGEHAIEKAPDSTLQEAAEESFDVLTTAIEKCQAAEKVSQEKSARALAQVTWATMHGLAALLMNGQIEPPETVENLTRFTTQTLGDGLET
jgi:AcrR family transcriptional regulator